MVISNLFWNISHDWEKIKTCKNAWNFFRWNLATIRRLTVKRLGPTCQGFENMMNITTVLLFREDTFQTADNWTRITLDNWKWALQYPLVIKTVWAFVWTGFRYRWRLLPKTSFPAKFQQGDLWAIRLDQSWKRASTGSFPNSHARFEFIGDFGLRVVCEFRK